MEQHKHFGSIMMVFFTVYTLVVLFTVLLALPVKAVEYLDSFPDEPEIQFVKSEIIDTCKNGSTITTFAYSIDYELGSLYVEAYLSSDKEEPISVMFAEYGDDGGLDIDIYMRELNRIAWYRSMFEFKEVYPNGICPKGTDL